PKLRSLAPSFDRDLETICARCLEREPKARYQSAGDLAADLERWLDGHPIVARPVSPPARIWRWSRRNPKLVGAATAGLFLGATAVWLFRGDDRHLEERFTAVPHPTETSSIGINVPVQSALNLFTVPDYKPPGDFDPGRPNTPVTAAHPATEISTTVDDRVLDADLRTNRIGADVTAAFPATEVTTSVRDRASEGGLQTNKTTAAVTAAPRATGVSTTNVRDRASEARLETNKTTADMTAAPPATKINTSVGDRASESSPQTNKIMADGPASIQGFVKDAKGEPIKGADVRIESRDGKQVFHTVKTDPKGRY